MAFTPSRRLAALIWRRQQTSFFSTATRKRKIKETRPETPLELSSWVRFYEETMPTSTYEQVDELCRKLNRSENKVVPLETLLDLDPTTFSRKLLLFCTHQQLARKPRGNAKHIKTLWTIRDRIRKNSVLWSHTSTKIQRSRSVEELDQEAQALCRTVSLNLPSHLARGLYAHLDHIVTETNLSILQQKIYEYTGSLHFHRIARPLSALLCNTDEADVRRDALYQKSLSSWLTLKYRLINGILTHGRQAPVSKDDIQRVTRTYWQERGSMDLMEDFQSMPSAPDQVTEAYADILDCAPFDGIIDKDRSALVDEADESGDEEESEPQEPSELEKRLTPDLSHIPESNVPVTEELIVATVKTKTKKKKEKKVRRGVHVTYEVSQVLDEKPSLACKPDSYMVVVDNLPIDITKEQIHDLYSRCGPLRSVQICNQRPDLDPGELSITALSRRRKDAIRRASTRTAKRWRRPCSPVYALLSFADTDGYEKATSPNLQLFGMVIQRHPARSIPLKKLKTLYLEGFQSRIQALALHGELEQHVGPGLLLSVLPGQRHQAKVESCELQFPSFEVAYEYYQVLRRTDLVPGEPQWKRTPLNAELWYTRKIGFD